MNRRFEGRCVAVGVLAAAALPIAGCAEEEEQQAPQATAVRLVTVEEATLEEKATGIGSLRSPGTAELQAETSGRVEEVHFEEGATVQRGELLFTLRSDALRARREARQASLRAARAQVAQARAAVARRAPLAGTGTIAEEEIANTRAELRQARADAARLRAELRELGEQLDDTRVVSPFDGHVSQRLVDPGDYVQVGEHLATLYETESLEAELRLPERLAGRVRTGQPVRIVPAGSTELAFDARVTFVSPAVEVSGRDLIVKAQPRQVAAVPEGVAPGMSITGELVLDTRRARPVLPAEALVGSREGYFVFVVEDGTARRRDVEVGLREPGLAEIVEGLRPGERVVSEGHMRLSDGTEVRALDDSETTEERS